MSETNATSNEHGPLRPRNRKPSRTLGHGRRSSRAMEPAVPLESRFSRLISFVVGLTLLASGIAIITFNREVAGFDASAVGWVLQFFDVGPILVVAEEQAVYWAAGLPTMMGVQVTVECTSAFLVGPAIVLAGLVGLTGRFSALRVIGAALAATVIILLTNWIRITLIAWATASFGIEGGYSWSHTVVGSIIALVGVLIGLVGAVMVLIRQRRSRRIAIA